jgi:outer membrane protein assembly factor BamB
MGPLRIVITLGLAALPTSTSSRPGWPQWGGPNRDFHVAIEAAPWPEGGPRIVWRRTVDAGYSAVTERDGVLYTMGRSGETERVIAISADTGETRWTYDYPAPLPEWMRTNHGIGPRSTPLLTEESIFTVGINGTLLCLDRARGTLRWKDELVSGRGGSRNTRGYASSPLALGDLVLLPVGGKGQSLVAFRQSDGSVAWQSGDFGRALSSPFLIELQGRPHVVALLDGVVAGFEPASGRLIWKHPHGGEGDRNVSTPVWGDDRLLFVSSAYGGGSRVLRLVPTPEKTEVEQLWADQQVRVMFTNALRIGGHVYASSGDFGPIPLTAVDVKTGTVTWRDRTFARLNMVKLGSRVLVLDEKGSLALVSLSPKGLEVHSRVQLADDLAWTAPSVVGRRAYVRTVGTLFALELPSRPDSPGGG